MLHSGMCVHIGAYNLSTNLWFLIGNWMKYLIHQKQIKKNNLSYDL